jgi:hypothetical protein
VAVEGVNQAAIRKSVLDDDYPFFGVPPRWIAVGNPASSGGAHWLAKMFEGNIYADMPPVESCPVNTEIGMFQINIIDGKIKSIHITAGSHIGLRMDGRRRDER